MRSTSTILAVTTLVGSLASGGLSAGPVTGELTEFRSASGLVERCIRIADFHGAHYSKHDRQVEARYCGLDFAKLALCPKLWSTSPGTVLYEIAGDDFAAFERQNCADRRQARQVASGHPANFKI